MAIDPSKFRLINVADTCSVWNVLSSPILHSAAKEARCEFCITSFVRYECLNKPRKKTPTAAETELMRRLGKGELSSIAFAMKIGQAIITDDRKARKLAEDSGHAHIQTTPHLFSWLIFSGRLGDADKETVIAQHKAMDRPLASHLETAYEMALQFRLNASRK